MTTTPYRSFIETQFPVALLSKESYKERKAGSGQTLTGLGKWWGRKPLVLVRATILGLLMPASTQPERDLETFLAVMTMDEEGRLLRKNKALTAKEMFELCTPLQREQFFSVTAKWLPSVSAAQKKALEQQLFLALPYEVQLDYCARPEQIEGPSEAAWARINAHLGTSATKLPELVQQLGMQRFGHTPRVGDAFCGGGSIPFEAARIGCEAFGNDLNPAAALLTWGALNLVGGGPEQAQQLKSEQAALLAKVDEQITAWGIEHDSLGRRADAFLYLTETVCPSCNWTVPVAPSFVIGEKSKTIAQLEPDSSASRFHIRIESNASSAVMTQAKKGTVKAGRLTCPHCGDSHAIRDLRGDKELTRKVSQPDGTAVTETETVWGLRKWENSDVSPLETDVFQERLYCIRWVETYAEDGADKTRRVYASVRDEDLARETKVKALLAERFADWQRSGFIPSRVIQPGDKTNEPIRTRGWTHWHHLFNPRQLLVGGVYSSYLSGDSGIGQAQLLQLGRLADWSNRCSAWLAPLEKVNQIFTNQALNTMYSYSARGFLHTLSIVKAELTSSEIAGSGTVSVGDSATLIKGGDFWVTDPPYADAVNYGELSEFFLAWYDKHLTRLFPEWYSDSKREQAVRGNDVPFRQTMVEVYRNLTRNMPANGKQVVMFTHQDPEVWADLALIMWAAGLEVTAAWTISTETSSGLKEGNYVTGTVCLVLQKQSSDEVGLIDNSFLKQIDARVKRTLQDMRELEAKSVSSYVDSDYLLAAYAAAMQQCTQYKQLYGRAEITPEAFLYAPRGRDWKHPFAPILERAVQAAMDFLMPKGFAAGESDTERRKAWLELAMSERFYLKGLELEASGVLTQGAYQEYARGFGMRRYDDLIADKRANQFRLKNPVELRRAGGSDEFKGTSVRLVLQALNDAVVKNDVEEGIKVLKGESESTYWSLRDRYMRCLQYFEDNALATWAPVQEMTRVLRMRIEADAYVGATGA